MTRHSIRFFSLLLAIALVLSICLIPAAAVESDSSAALLAGTAGRAMLTEKEQLVYDFLKENIDLAADGKQSSSVFTLDAAALRAWEQKGIQITWTKEDFGAEMSASLPNSTWPRSWRLWSMTNPTACTGSTRAPVFPILTAPPVTRLAASMCSTPCTP